MRWQGSEERHTENLSTNIKLIWPFLFYKGGWLWDLKRLIYHAASLIFHLGSAVRGYHIKLLPGVVFGGRKMMFDTLCISHSPYKRSPWFAIPIIFCQRTLHGLSKIISPLQNPEGLFVVSMVTKWPITFFDYFSKWRTQLGLWRIIDFFFPLFLKKRHTYELKKARGGGWKRY